MVTLECEGRGVPLPTVTWYRNGEAILSSRQTQYVDRGHYLRIPRVQASDAGQYTCKVTSVAGSAEKNYKLDVYRKNLIIFTLSNVFFPTLYYNIYYTLPILSDLLSKKKKYLARC